jgi:hypothetical protein
MKLHARNSLARIIWLPLLLGSLLIFPAPLTAPPSAHAASACTLYAGPYGSATNAGTTTSSPLTLNAAETRTVPGAVVCLLAGTYSLSSPFYIARSGTSSAWIVYRSYDGTAQLNWTGGQDSVLAITAGVRYVEVDGLTVNGNNASASGINCNSATHLRFSGNTVINNGGGGIVSVRCDYLYVDHNLVWHTGYGEGWGSGISLNTTYWSDGYAGFHSFVTNNIVSGTTDASVNHSDGNGIIMDTGGNTPPVLIANNLVYENGGRCIHLFLMSNAWVVGNTCYKNGLNLLNNPALGEISLLYATNGYVANNTVDAWQQHPPYFYANSQANFAHNTYFGGGSNYGLPSSVLSDPSQLLQANPNFLNPFAVDPSAGNQYASAPPPWQISNQFQFAATSPLAGLGGDARSLTGNTALQSGMGQYLFADLSGTSRPQGSRWDPGAFEYPGSISVPTSTPQPTTTATATATATPAGSTCAPVSWINMTKVSVSGNSLRKTGTAYAWDAGASGITSVTSGSASVQVTADSAGYGRMFGLTHTYSGPSYTGIAYAIELQSTGVLDIYEAGQWRAEPGRYAVGDVLKVAVQQGVVRYYRNGALLYTSRVTPIYPLASGASIRDPQGQLANASFCTGGS